MFCIQRTVCFLVEWKQTVKDDFFFENKLLRQSDVIFDSESNSRNFSHLMARKNIFRIENSIRLYYSRCSNSLFFKNITLISLFSFYPSEITKNGWKVNFMISTSSNPETLGGDNFCQGKVSSHRHRSWSALTA